MILEVGVKTTRNSLAISMRQANFQSIMLRKVAVHRTIDINFL